MQKRGNYEQVQIHLKGYPSISSTFETKAEEALWAAQQEKQLNEQSPAQVVQRMKGCTLYDTAIQQEFDLYIVKILPGKNRQSSNAIRDPYAACAEITGK